MKKGFPSTHPGPSTIQCPTIHPRQSHLDRPGKSHRRRPRSDPSSGSSGAWRPAPQRGEARNVCSEAGGERRTAEDGKGGQESSLLGPVSSKKTQGCSGLLLLQVIRREVAQRIRDGRPLSLSHVGLFRRCTFRRASRLWTNILATDEEVLRIGSFRPKPIVSLSL